MKSLKIRQCTNVLIVPRFQRVRQGFISMRSFAGKIHITILFVPTVSIYEKRSINPELLTL